MKLVRVRFHDPVLGAVRGEQSTGQESARRDEEQVLAGEHNVRSTVEVKKLGYI